MPIAVRPAVMNDIPSMTELLIQDAKWRENEKPAIWKLGENGPEKLTAVIESSLNGEHPSLKRQWLVAEHDGTIVGVLFTLLLPVPPIYAGELGPPGLIMENGAVSSNAPAETQQSLLEAAEADLKDKGAKIILGSSMTGGKWEESYRLRDYEPLTIYLAKSNLKNSRSHQEVRPANENDLEDIVSSNTLNGTIKSSLNAFWKPHEDATARFHSWMEKSLTLPDRDMFVLEDSDGFTGFAISQPLTGLHLPTPLSIEHIGIIDDYFHANIADPINLKENGGGATKLLEAAEHALHQRGNSVCLVVCPAAWKSKIELLSNAGFAAEITWYRKR